MRFIQFRPHTHPRIQGVRTLIGIGQKFPAFSLTGVVSNDIKTAFQPFDNGTAAGKWQVVFFWPKDFTFVCPTEIAAFGILDAEAGVAQRATYIFDPQGVVRFVYITDLSVGRSSEEALRVLDVLRTDELCPCNGQKGEDTLKAA